MWGRACVSVDFARRDRSSVRPSAWPPAHTSPRPHLSLAPSVTSSSLPPSPRPGSAPTPPASTALTRWCGSVAPSFLMQPQALPVLVRADAAAVLDGGCVRGSSMETRPWRPLPRRQHRRMRRTALLAAACADRVWRRVHGVLSPGGCVHRMETRPQF